MIHDLQCLARRVQRLQVAMLDAPVPRNLKYNEDQAMIFESPDIQETMFATKFQKHIPRDYLSHFKNTMENVSEWLLEYATDHNYGFNSALKVHYKKDQKLCRDFMNHVIEIQLAIYTADDSLSLTWVVVRPCAERHRFYTEVLFQLQEMVKHYRFHKLIVESITKNNRGILDKMGFFFENNDAYYTQNNLKFVTEEKWHRPTFFPSADFLNNEVLVNQYYFSKYYKTDYDMPERYKEYPDKEWFDVLCLPCDSDLEEEKQSDAGEESPRHRSDSGSESDLEKPSERKGSAHKKSRFE
jgi:hypothetical protein